MLVSQFLDRWLHSAGSERANKDMFLSELCDVLGVERPAPRTPDAREDDYVFEASVPKLAQGRNTTGFVDLYKRGTFLIEAKQGGDPERGRIGTARRNTPGWHMAMHDALGQALAYARALDAPPPILMIVDIGHCIDVHACFDGSGDYRPFPDAKRSRLWLADLEQHLDLLRTLWSKPLDLDPSARAAEVTREVATLLADLARDLERAGHSGPTVSGFLIRSVFTMFAEDIELLPGKPFTTALKQRWAEHPQALVGELPALWRAMDEGGMFGFERFPRFNGRLFKDPAAIALNARQIKILYDAATRDWSHVEPAIFGTLVERALNADERHALGAHYTPRSYVERLVRPTVMEPLREEWSVVLAEVRRNVERDQIEAAQKKVEAFLLSLASIRILDPACGSGNFLYVTLDLLKRLETEVMETRAALGVRQEGLEIRGSRVGPHQFYGIEKKPLARDIAEVVLWIGHLQWHRRLHGRSLPPEPVLFDLGQIVRRDSILRWDAIEQVVDEAGVVKTRWDRTSMRAHPVTGALVPDETSQVPVERYLGAAKADPWPQVEFIVGNPPFLGTKRMRAVLGDAYVDALRQVWKGEVQDNADLVMYWWHRAAQATQDGVLRRFGFITTNSVGQAFNRRVLQHHLDRGLQLLWAVPDHPWVDDVSQAAVRIAMTVAAVQGPAPRIARVVQERASAVPGEPPEVDIEERVVAELGADLGGGARTTQVLPLQANRGICGNGVALHGAGFILEPQAAAVLSLGPQDPTIRRYLGGRDLLRVPRELYVIDFSFQGEAEAERANPAAFQHLLMHVRPEREQNRRAALKDRWWRFAWERPLLRDTLRGLPRYIATTETAKHRVFQFLPATVLPDHKILAIASADAFHLGVLSSRFHVAYSTTLGSRLGVGNDPVYTKSTCFDPFPFPATTPEIEARIRSLAEDLDAHRKRQQAAHPDLSLTETYNVLARLRLGEPLTAKERRVHDQAVASVLLRQHEALDAAVQEAYGWEGEMSDEEIIEALVLLNAERVEEEGRGQVRWLRPDRAGRGQEEGDAPIVEEERTPWPASTAERLRLLRTVLGRGPASVEHLSARIDGATADGIADGLSSLEALDLAEERDGQWTLRT